MWGQVIKKASLVRKGGDEREGDQKSLTMRERERERGGKKFGEKNTYILVAFFCVCRLENVYGFMTRLLRKFKYIYF